LYKKLDRALHGFEGRARSEEHRKEVLKAHYHLQNLKNTLAQIKANKYNPAVITTTSLSSKAVDIQASKQQQA